MIRIKMKIKKRTREVLKIPFDEEVRLSYLGMLVWLKTFLA